nr:hypothetical protein [Tanacetum cinerariifolium]
MEKLGDELARLKLEEDRGDMEKLGDELARLKLDEVGESWRSVGAWLVFKIGITSYEYWLWIVSSGWSSVSAVLGQMTYPVASLTLDSARVVIIVVILVVVVVVAIVGVVIIVIIIGVLVVVTIIG